MEGVIRPFATFCLLFSAMLGTYLVLNDPSVALLDSFRGKSRQEVSEDIRSFRNNTTKLALTVLGCKYIAYYIAYFVFAMFIEPLAIITALSRNMGSRELAYAMGIIVIIFWLYYFFAERFKKKLTKGNTTVVVIQGRTVQGDLINDQEMPRIPSRAAIFLLRVFFALPRFYLWYLSGIALGLIPG